VGSVAAEWTSINDNSLNHFKSWVQNYLPFLA